MTRGAGAGDHRRRHRHHRHRHHHRIQAVEPRRLPACRTLMIPAGAVPWTAVATGDVNVNVHELRTVAPPLRVKVPVPTTNSVPSDVDRRLKFQFRTWLVLLTERARTIVPVDGSRGIEIDMLRMTATLLRLIKSQRRM